MWFFFIVMPAMFLVIGLWQMADSLESAADAMPARGEVIRVESTVDSEGHISYRPTIRYQRSDGKMQVAKTHMRSSGYDFNIGHQIDILYSFNDPAEVRIDSFFAVYGFGLVFSGGGAAFIAIGLLWYLRKRPRRRVVERGLDETSPPEAGTERDATTTDPSQPGHVHEPKPKRAPAVRRMR